MLQPVAYVGKDVFMLQPVVYVGKDVFMLQPVVYVGKDVFMLQPVVYVGNDVFMLQPVVYVGNDVFMLQPVVYVGKDVFMLQPVVYVGKDVFMLQPVVYVGNDVFMLQPVVYVGKDVFMLQPVVYVGKDVFMLQPVVYVGKDVFMLQPVVYVGKDVFMLQPVVYVGKDVFMLQPVVYVGKDVFMLQPVVYVGKDVFMLQPVVYVGKDVFMLQPVVYVGKDVFMLQPVVYVGKDVFMLQPVVYVGKDVFMLQPVVYVGKDVFMLQPVVYLDLGVVVRGGREVAGVGYVANTHTQAYEGEKSIVSRQLGEAHEVFEQYVRDTHRPDSEVVMFAVMGGDFNADNISKGDQAVQNLPLFDEYEDPCVVVPGQDAAWAVGTEHRQKLLHHPSTTHPSTFRSVLLDDVMRRHFMLDADVESSTLELMRSAPRPDADGQVRAVTEGGRRRIDKLVVKRGGEMAPVGYWFSTVIAGLTDHLPVVMMLQERERAKEGCLEGGDGMGEEGEGRGGGDGMGIEVVEKKEDERPELHRWTWYSNAGGVAKGIDHILVSTRWRILLNCRVYRSAEFFGTDHRLVVATLKLHVKSRRISRGNHTVFHLEKLKDLTCAHEYAVAVSNRFDVLGALGDPVELWDTFKRETLQAAKECIGERPRSRRGFVSTETLEKIEESRAARLAGNRDQHRALSRWTRTLLGRDKERYVRSLAEDVEGHLNANDLRPAYRALKKLRSKSPSRASAIRTADGRLVSDMDGQMASWAEYFGQLFTVDPPTEQLHTTGLQAVDADPPIDESAPSLDEVREAVAKLRGGKAAGVCNISAELLKAGGEAMIRGLHAVLTAVWQQSAVKCGAGVSSFFPVNTGVRQGCVLAPSLFNACMDWVLDKVVDQSNCGASVGNTKITDLVFADDAVIFAESLKVLVMALEALHEEAKPLGLEVSWLKTKVQVFGDLLDEAVQSVHACGEDIEILESFTYLGSAVHNDGGSRQEVLRRIGIAHGVMDSLSGSIWHCRYLCRRTKIRIFKSLVIPVLLYGLVTPQPCLACMGEDVCSNASLAGAHFATVVTSVGPHALHCSTTSASTPVVGGVSRSCRNRGGGWSEQAA
ncbi:Sphingomyelin phosphodiesterase 3 [Chionoecetes opilio]|uniref:Sphingomyelin phosphodiesterase 3 n=1 Tax=Chionoecetes opilio TaxID=41210 RepID=A0A8J4Y963_CHIOP|nr:Sphingomyelin phosphodiesterase 3 [Chionoecetes opilio]